MKNVILMHLLRILLNELPTTEAQEKTGKLMRIGIIGLDTSHVPAFTGLFNDPKNEGDLAGFKVVAGFPGGSSDVPASYERIKKFTSTIKEKYGVEIVDSIDTLLTKVDAVLIESVDGRPHLAQVMPVLKAGKIVYGTVIFGDKGNLNTIGYVGGYKPLVVEIARFFRSGKAPVSAEETTEIFAFMEAADESKRQGGAPVTLESVLSKARELNK